MSRAVKDSLIMATAAGSVALLVAGAEIGVPAVAAAGAAVALGAVVAKLITIAAEPPDANQNGHRPKVSNSDTKVAV